MAFLSAHRVLESTFVCLACVAIWTAVVASGMLTLIDYSTAPNHTTLPSRATNADAIVDLEKAHLTLVMFLHPHCPCSRSSLNELARLLDQSRVDVAVKTVFYCPAGEKSEWTMTNLWERARNVSDAYPIVDKGGLEAKRLGVQISGHTFLFERNGECLYSGGITPGRGHEGNNPGRESLLRLLKSETREPVEFPVYGCPIVTEVTTVRVGETNAAYRL